MNTKIDYERWYQALLNSTTFQVDTLSPWYQMVLTNLKELEGKKILEVASGKGEISEFLHKNSKILVSGDISFTACKYLQTKLLEKKITPNVVVCDITNLPFKQNTFDVVISCETLEHIDKPQNGIAELVRVSTKGAYFYITTPNYINIFGLYRIYLYIRGQKFNSSGVPQPIENVIFSLSRLLKKYNLKILKTDGMCFYALLLPRIRPESLRLKFIDRIYWLRQLLKPFALHRLVVATK